MTDEFYPGSLKEAPSIGATSTIAEGMFFKGNLIGDKHLVVGGRIEGRIDISGADVTVREMGVVKSNIVADHVTIEGKVYGDVTGTQQVVVGEKGVVMGNITSPRVALADGCNFKGRIDMDAKTLNKVIATLKAVEKVVANEEGQQEAVNDAVTETMFKAANE